MKHRLALLAILFLGVNFIAGAQELYVFTEPASNMPTNAVGIRVTNEGMFEPQFNSRSIAEVMVGLNKNFMFHVQGFLSDMDGRYRLEGGSLYAKYRLLSIDAMQSHSRAAVYARISMSDRPTYTRDINLEGDNAGWQAGMVFTQLVHKLALSATLGYSKVFEQNNKQITGAHRPDQLLNYSLSSGYLLLPFTYKNYSQPNLNLYFEVLGKTDPSSGNSYVDLAPAVQLILNSKTRIDLGYRFQATGNIAHRYLKNMYLVRVEFNFFNALTKKQ